MKKLYDLIDWKIEKIMPEMKDCKKFDDLVRENCWEKEFTDPDFKKLKEPVLNLNFGGLVVVMGLPIVEKEKLAKLKALFHQKLFPSINVSGETDLENFELEFNEDTGFSTGNAIIKFKEEEKAIKAAQNLNGILIPPKFKLTVLTLTEFEEAMTSYASTDNAQPIDHYELVKNHESNLKLEKVFCAVANSKSNSVEIMSYDYYDKQFSNECSIECSFIPKSISFSDSGSLLTTIMGNHFEIYGYSDFRLIRKFMHKLVSIVKYSRKDKYAISFNGQAGLTYGSENLIVWNILTGAKIRSFQINAALNFEFFNFAYSEQYLSGMVKSLANEINMVCVYELPTCQLLLDQNSKERTPLNAEGVISMAWAPYENALFVASCKDSKAEINIYEIPSRRKIPWISIPFRIDMARPFWGEHEKSIILIMDTHLKKKNETTIQLATIDWLKKQCYVNMLTLEDTTEKSEITVSPNGLYFVVLTPQKIGANFLFYAIEEKNKSMAHSLLFKLQNQNMKYVSFSPFSNFVVIYNEQKVWFAEIKPIKNKHQFRLIREVDHKSEAGSAAWSSCGRFVSFTSRASDTFTVDLFDFIGRLVCSHLMRGIRDFVFRPFSFAKESILNSKAKEKLQKEVEAQIKVATEEEKKIKSERKYMFKMKQMAGFTKLQKYLEMKYRKWEDLKPFRTQRLGFDDENLGDMVKFTRIDKEEVIEEIEIIN